ncbi:MAG TPA: dTDP-4-dehydrorhamnose reductase [Candidatus Binatia bacterium]
MNSRRRVAVIGSGGQLGTDLVETFQSHEAFEVIPLTRAQADCTDAESVRKAVLQLRPPIVVNCAAFVRVDECENQPQQAFVVNAVGALHVARACAEADSICVYISTDYVFDGSKAGPYSESDSAYPVNVYGASKLAGEILVRQTVPHWLIVRAASLFGRTGARGKGGNFVETIIAKAKTGEPLRIVNDVRMSPTYTRDAATALVGLVEGGADGIVHLTNDGACTWHEFAEQILDLVGLRVSIVPVSSEEYPTPARRPTNSVLRSERSLVKLRSWKDALKAYLIEKGHMSAS